MGVTFHFKKVCCHCGKVFCSCLLSIGIAIAGLSHTMHPVVLTPTQGEPPHTENQMDTRQVREPPKLSTSTASTVVYRATLGPGFQISGFRADASDATDGVFRFKFS
jgi:hypothetical protein